MDLPKLQKEILVMPLRDSCPCSKRNTCALARIWQSPHHLWRAKAYFAEDTDELLDKLGYIGHMK
jgi:hypothetical protein